MNFSRKTQTVPAAVPPVMNHEAVHGTVLELLRQYMPEKFDLDPEEERQAMESTVKTAVASPWMDDATFTDRERDELMFARAYASYFNHGTNGHNGYVILAKLCTVIDQLIQQVG